MNDLYEREKNVHQAVHSDRVIHPDCHFCFLRIVDRLREYEKRETAVQEREAKLREEIEILGWNLAGCSTFALGYGLDEGHDKEKARPAMSDVHKLALKARGLEANNVKLWGVVERLRECLDGAYDVAVGRITDGLRKRIDEALAESASAGAERLSADVRNMSTNISVDKLEADKESGREG